MAQRAGMEHVEPFIFNGVRFALGGSLLIPFVVVNQRRRVAKNLPIATAKTLVFGGGLAGLVLFVASSLQQIGIIYTTAGKAGFITGLYVIIVPIMGLLWGQRSSINAWAGAVLAAIGLYLLSVTEDFNISTGDLLVLIGAFLWAGHVHIIDRFSGRIEPVKLALIQFFICSILSLITAVIIETITLRSLLQAAIPILYGGLVSVGIAYTLQVVGQRHAHPTHAAIILSLETVFAVVGGWLILSETLLMRELTGCAFMLAGMLLSQLNIRALFRGGSNYA